MKKNVIYFIFTSLLLIGCAKKEYQLNKSEINTSNSISLDSYQSNDEGNRIKSVINSKEYNTIKVDLDGKEYDSALMESILDTIKGNYSMQIDNNKNKVKIIRTP